ncbi:VOC family protein [Nocardia sp. NPDC003693]
MTHPPDAGAGAHRGLHAEQGALPGEHPGRHRDPVIKAADLAWLEFEKPDLARTAAFAADFGFTPTLHTATELHLRGALAGPPCVIVRRGRRSAFRGIAFRAADTADLRRLAAHTGTTVTELPEVLGGRSVSLTDPGGLRVRLVGDTVEYPAQPRQGRHDYNTAGALTRVNATQRPPVEPARVERLGHVVVQTTRYRRTLDWYLEHLGLIVSDFLFYPGQRARGPVMSFIRCDRGPEPADHHTLALTLGPSNRYVHSAFQVADLDALAAGGEYLRRRGHDRSWGIGRHIQGSQIFDYWRDPDGLLVEHFTDGDLFDHTLDPGWAPMTASGLNQWGDPATPDFLGLRLSRAAVRELFSIVPALRDTDNEFDLHRLRGLLKVAST